MEMKIKDTKQGQGGGEGKGKQGRMDRKELVERTEIQGRSENEMT